MIHDRAIVKMEYYEIYRMVLFVQVWLVYGSHE